MRVEKRQLKKRRNNNLMSVIATHRVSIDLSDRKHQEQAAQAARLAESCSSSVERLKEESLGVPADQARRARMAF